MGLVAIDRGFPTFTRGECIEIDPNLCNDDDFNLDGGGSSMRITVALSDDIAKQTIGPDDVVGSLSVSPASRLVMGLHSSDMLNVSKQCLAQFPVDIAAKMMRPFTSPENIPCPAVSQTKAVTQDSWALCRSQTCTKDGLGVLVHDELRKSFARARYFVR